MLPPLFFPCGGREDTISSLADRFFAVSEDDGQYARLMLTFFFSSSYRAFRRRRAA
jgi:hypothetical protein